MEFKQDYTQMISGNKGVKLNATDGLFYATARQELEVLVNTLKSLDSQIDSKEKEYNLLETTVDTLLGDSALVKKIVPNTWAVKYKTAWEKKVNDWYSYMSKNKWSSQTINDVLWQIWNTLKTQKQMPEIGLTDANKNGYSAFNLTTNNGTNYEKFYNWLGQSGLFYYIQDLSYTNLTKAERLADLKYNEIVKLQSEYEKTYDAAQAKVDDIKVFGDLFNDLKRYDRRKERKDRIAKRKSDRKTKKDARKRVDSIIWNLENKHNPIERDLKAKYESGLVKLDVLSKENSEVKEAEFEKVLKETEDAETKLYELQTKTIEPLEEELKTYGDKYNFAERKEAKYYRKEANKTYRSTKKALKATYKSLYGKGWRKEGWSATKTDLQQERDEIRDRYASPAMKVGNAIKTGALTPIRLAFLGLVYLNAFNITGRLLAMKNNVPEIYDNFRFKWKKFGGNRTELDETIVKNGSKKAFPPFGDKLMAKFNATGVEETAAEVATASPLLTQLSATFASVSAWVAANPEKSAKIAVDITKQFIDSPKGSPTGDEETDEKLKDEAKKASIDLINAMVELSATQKADAIKFINEGFSLDEALEKIGVDLGKPTDPDSTDPKPDNPNWLLWGGIAAGVILIGLISYFVLRKKK